MEILTYNNQCVFRSELLKFLSLAGRGVSKTILGFVKLIFYKKNFPTATANYQLLLHFKFLTDFHSLKSADNSGHVSSPLVAIFLCVPCVSLTRPLSARAMAL